MKHIEMVLVLTMLSLKI